MNRNDGYRLIEERVVNLVCRVIDGRLTLPTADVAEVTSHDAIDLVTAMLAGRPIGVFVATDARNGVVVDGARRLAALTLAFRSPSEGGLSIADPTSDTPTVVTGSRPGNRKPGEYIPLVATAATMHYLRWRNFVVTQADPSEQVMDRLEGVASHIAAYSVPVVCLPYGADPGAVRVSFRMECVR